MSALTEDDLFSLSLAWIGAGALIVAITTAIPDVVYKYWMDPDLALCMGFSFLLMGIVVWMVTPWGE